MSFLSKFFAAKKSDANNIKAVASAYGKVFGNFHAINSGISELPLPKDQIAKTLIDAIKKTPIGEQREQLKTGFIMLSDFQDLKLCEQNVQNPSKEGLAEAERMLRELNKAGL